jgi:hypothetical protein
MDEPVDVYTRKGLMDALHKAGTKFDGHVTNGSLLEQMKIVDLYARSLCPGLFGETEEITAEDNQC